MTDILLTLVLALAWGGIALYAIRRFDPDVQALLMLSFVAHQLSAVCNIWMTKYYYGYGDLLSYHRFGVLAAERLRSDFWGLAPDLVRLMLHERTPIAVPVDTLSSSSGTMQAVSSFAMLLCFDSLYAACACVAGAAFLTKLALLSVMQEELPHLPRRWLVVACTLLPSALFWSTSLLKEPLAMIGLLSALFGWYQFVQRRRGIISALLVVFGCITVIYIKGYAFPALGLSIAAFHFAREVRSRRGDIVFSVGQVLLVAAAAVGVVAATGAVLPQFGVTALGEQLAGLQTVGASIEAGTNYSLGATAGDARSQTALAPLGLLTALFRPLVFEARSAPVLISSLEMSAFLVAFIALLFRRGIPSCLSQMIRYPFLSFCATFVVVFGTCVGLGTTNLGTLSRYRMPLTPFFASLLLALLQRTNPTRRQPSLPISAPASSPS